MSLLSELDVMDAGVVMQYSVKVCITLNYIQLHLCLID